MAASGGSWKTVKSGKNRGQRRFTRPKSGKPVRTTSERGNERRGDSINVSGGTMVTRIARAAAGQVR